MLKRGMRQWVRGAMLGAMGASLIAIDTPAHADTTTDQQKAQISAVADVVNIAGDVSNVYGAFQAAEGILQMLDIIQGNDMSAEFASLHSYIDQVAGNLSWFIAESTREADIADMQNQIVAAGDLFNHGVDLSLNSAEGANLESVTVGLVGRAMANTAYLRYYYASQTDGVPVYDDVAGSFTWKDVISFSPSDLHYQNGYVYDWREGVPAFMQLVALRIQAMAMEDPDFIQNGTFYDELMTYRDFLLNQIYTVIDGVRCGVQQNPPTVGSDDPTQDANYRYWISCADISTGLNETSELVFGPGYPLAPDACITSYDQDGHPVYDQNCETQRETVDYQNWYQANVQPTVNQAQRDVWNMQPWYQMLALINTLFHYANDTTDPTWGASLAISPTTNTNLCLATQNDGTDPGTIAELHACYSSNSEEWYYDRLNEAIVNANSGLCLDVQWGSNAPATPVWTWDCNGGSAQRWTYEAESNVFWNMLGYTLTAANWDLEAGVPLVTWYDDGSDAQHWQ